ncbi:MAG: WD40 repeat domain-containing protein [Planctomycetota bacterium]
MLFFGDDEGVAPEVSAARLEAPFEVPDFDLSHVPAPCFTSDGRALLAGTDNGQVVAFVSSDRAMIAPLAQGARVLDLARLPDPDGGLLVLRAGGALDALDPDGGPRASVARIHSAARLALRPGGDEVALACGSTVEVRGARDLRLRGRLAAPASVDDLCWVGDSLALACDDGSLTLLGRDGSARRLAWEPAGLLAVAAAPDGRRLAFGGGSRRISLLDLDQGVVVPLRSRLRGQVTTLAFSPDGRRLAAGSDESDLWAFDLSRRALLFHDVHHQGCALTRARWSPDGARLLFGCRPNGTTPTPFATPRNLDREIAASPEGQRLEAALRRAEGALRAATAERLGAGTAGRLLLALGAFRATAQPRPSPGVAAVFFPALPDTQAGWKEPVPAVQTLAEPLLTREELERVQRDPVTAPLLAQLRAAQQIHAAHHQARAWELGGGFQIDVWRVDD